MSARRMIAEGTKRGYTFVELTVALAIVLVILAMAMPNLLRARQQAGQAAVEVAMRSIVTAQFMYQAQYQGYAPSLQALGPPRRGQLPSASAADMIDEYLSNGVRNGYRFRYTPLDLNGDGVVDSYFVNADPESHTRGRYYFVDPTAVVRSELARPASERSKPASMGGGEQ